MMDPHGGTLVNLLADPSKDDRSDTPTLVLSRRAAADFEMLASGALSPLTGFMGQEDYQNVLNDMYLTDGFVWTIPVMLPIDDAERDQIGNQETVNLVSAEGDTVGSIAVQDIFKYDKEEEAEKVYLTTDHDHPGVARLFDQGNYYLAGDVTAHRLPSHERFGTYRKTAQELRQKFQEMEWRTVVAFQTRNPIHRAHEYITKCALELVDGLLLHPIVGETKGDDIPAEVRMDCYEAILDNYYPHRHTVLSVFPAFMRYAGPREAVFHAITRKNYGCTHFIVGRDHAGVRDYYGTYDAQRIFDRFSRDELGIEPMFFEHAFYCKRTDLMATTKTSRAMDHEKIYLSGSKVRETLMKGERLPEEFTRPEVEVILRRYYQNE
ncbi:MAG: sulfate adenylyltransferase [Candidatus Marinimicrobia bacterium]|jgi:sulfate adenylyltransferase|nr:sulfate adenylyltransferase [Candidatus Neomarinimicrobiota bacterium]MDP6592596.1 sulfate adenylyltransferase [Candidatus Neomarinimicrobiota bacterium]MDP6836673.1 sulfate adenylyltransferase [Candidatus Neomarinimicrobiota bacterium]